MGEIGVPREMFLWSMAIIYLFAFASLYIQIPGLFGDEGVVPVRLQMPREAIPVEKQLLAAPSLLWLAPYLGIGAQQGMELICLLGVLLSLLAVLVGVFRDSLVYFCLWALYLSLYTVGGDFLHSEWDNLLLEAGFLALLVAPFLRRSSSTHDAVTFWLVRWLLFRLVFSTGVSKLASKDPSWWDLTALSRHYQTQESPTPLAWYAYQLPNWLLRLGAVGVLAVEISVPLLMFLIPVHGLRSGAFCIQVFTQLCAILLGGCNIFNLLTIALSFSLLDDEHSACCTALKKKAKTRTWGQFFVSALTFLFRLAIYLLIIFGAMKFFKLEFNWEKKIVTSKTTFTENQFDEFMRNIQAPTVWMGVLSLTWEVVAAMLKCLYARGILGKLWALIQWVIFSAAAVGVLTLSVVPYTALTGTTSNILPEVRLAYSVVEKYQLVSSYGTQHRTIPPAGRPEIIIEGSDDKKTWTELNFMYKPGSVSGAPVVLGPHEPRLEELLWEAARGGHDQSPWFTGLIQRLLEGKEDVESLVQVDEAQYPFSSTPPEFVRAKVYHYHFTRTAEDGTQPKAWWKREFVRDFFPTVHLGDSVLTTLLNEAGLKKTFPVQPSSDTQLSQALSVLQGHAKGLSGPMLILSLLAAVASILLLKVLFSWTGSSKGTKPKTVSSEQKRKPKAAADASGKSHAASSRGGKKDNSEERKLDSDRSPRKRK
ncbi:lipase maturation factor 2b [Trichomycterus rosablanca]|uniref:lipase maturation factor 2b n=1 Tax=Trichomycterus rosablanca TaxID=2290929 RepID=UPI002F358AC2